MIDIGIVTYNRLELTKICLDSIFKFTNESFNVFIADNGSKDGTVEYLQKLYRDNKIQRLLLFKKNGGIAPAINSLWEISENRYFLKLDNDIEILKENWLSEMKNILEMSPELKILAFSFLEQLYKIRFPIKKLSSGYEVQVSPANLGGGCLLIPKSTKEKFGYFCEDYSPYGEEDVDYSFRLKNQRCLLPNLKATDWMKHNYLKTNELHNAKEYRQHKNNFRKRNTSGLLQANLLLYKNKLRSIKMRRKFITEVKSNSASLSLNKSYLKSEYKILREFLKKMKSIPKKGK